MEATAHPSRRIFRLRLDFRSDRHMIAVHSSRSRRDACFQRVKSGFLDKLIERLGRVGPEDVQNYLLRLAQEKGLIETVFNAIQEGIIVTDESGRITYINEAACHLFGLDDSAI